MNHCKQETGKQCLISLMKIASGLLDAPNNPVCVPIEETSTQLVPPACIRRTRLVGSVLNVIPNGVGHSWVW